MRILFFALLLFCIGPTGQAQLQRFSFTESKMGSPFSIVLFAADSLQATTVSAGCFRLVDSLVVIFSDYIDSSELNRLCVRAGTANGFACSAALYDILSQSATAWKKSKGSFDITLGPLTRLWRQARKEKKFPTAIQIKEKRALTGFSKVRLDNSTHTAWLRQAGMQLDLGGIGQGYIAQKTIDFILANGIENALVDVSGDIACIGHPTGRSGWSVAINVPESRQDLLPDHLLLSNQAVTTSGDVYQYMEHAGKRYSHIIDPATGYGLTSQKNVTVITRDGTTADWLTKACSILPIEQAKNLAHRLQAEVLIAEMKKGKVVRYQSKGFAAYWAKRTKRD